MTAQKVEAELLREKRELEDRERALQLEIEKKLEAERAAFRASFEKEAQERIARVRAEALRTSQHELADAKARLAEAATREAELVKQKGALEEAQRRLAAEAERRIQEETRKAREALDAKASEQKALLEAEHRKQREALEAQIVELQRRLTQDSQQAQGEAQEVVPRDLVERSFPHDAISDVGPGVEGADLVQLVRDEHGARGGTIPRESKRPKSWSDAWLPKLRDDLRAGPGRGGSIARRRFDEAA